MYQFTNKFSVALNRDRTEALISFYQNTPTIPDEYAEDEVVQDMKPVVVPIVSLAMTGQCAKNLASSIMALIDAEDFPE